MKNTLYITCLLILAVLITACGSANSTDHSKSLSDMEPFRLSDYIDIPRLNQTYYEDLPEQDIDVDAAYVLHANTNDVLYEENSDKSLPVASMSKIMSEYIILQAIENEEIAWEDKVKISDYAYDISNKPGFASVDLKQKKKYTVEELFQAMSIGSANGATIALAEEVAGSEKEFVELMNEEAKKLQLDNSSFVNSSGLSNNDLGDDYSVGKSSDDNKMSAADLAALSNRLIKEYPEIFAIIGQTELDFAGETYNNSNWMLPGSDIDFIEEDLTYKGVNGLKTGYTEEAGYGFTGSVEIGEDHFISVVIGADSYEDRFKQTAKLYDALKELIKEEQDK